MSAPPSSFERRSIRLKVFDYSQNGAYFITINAHSFQNIFGAVKNGEFIESAFGAIVKQEWERTEDLRPDVSLDIFVVMPNHFHGILIISNPTRTSLDAARREAFGNPQRGTVLTIIRAFKAASTRRINKLRETPGGKVWHRNYYEQVIRNERDLQAQREYIENNLWKWDTENPGT